jgi:hypothetical protein
VNDVFNQPPSLSAPAPPPAAEKVRACLAQEGSWKGGGKLKPGRVTYPKTGSVFHDAVVEVVDRTRNVKDLGMEVVAEGGVKNIGRPSTGKPFTNYYDAALTPIPFDKQLLMNSPIPPPPVVSTQAGPTPRLTPPGNPFTSMSALTQSFLSARTPLDDLRDKLTSGAL